MSSITRYKGAMGNPSAGDTPTARSLPNSTLPTTQSGRQTWVSPSPDHAPTVKDGSSHRAARFSCVLRNSMCRCHPAPLSKARTEFGAANAGYRQVFGLTGNEKLPTGRCFPAHFQ